MKYGKLAPKGSIIGSIVRGKAPMKKWTAQVYIPLAPRVLVYRGPPSMPYEGKTVFNLWRDSGMKPKTGEHQWFLDHVAKLFPNDKVSQRHVIDYMAQLVQHPNVKIYFALLIQSIEGAGKGALGRLLRRMIGDRNAVEPSNDEAVKTWTGWQERAQLAIINELYAAGDTAVLNRLKSPITEDKLRIEKKFGNVFSIPNYLNFVCFSNHKDALKLTPTDRRWLVLFSRWTPGPNDKAYYDNLFDNCIANNSKVAAVLAFLLDHKISFNPKGHAPMTEAKIEMVERNRDDYAVTLDERWSTRAKPFEHDLVRAEDIVDWLRDDRNKHDKKLGQVAIKFLDTINAVRLPRYTHRDLPSFQIYAVANHAEWQGKSRRQVALAYRDTKKAEDDFADQDA